MTKLTKQQLQQARAIAQSNGYTPNRSTNVRRRKKKKSTEYVWNHKVGDIVVVKGEYSNTQSRSRRKSKKTPWYVEGKELDLGTIVRIEFDNVDVLMVNGLIRYVSAKEIRRMIDIEDND
ncbi:hypothetical protein CL622_02030 [archaeon]|nr:hypothetical protein [archaeon]|tara:strand:- start:516 stop:875 length:360 start_codon:yes stop_codon:yes gene_type:complete